MKTRNIFSYIMWGVFAVLLSALFYFSALEFLNSLNILNNQYNAIIVVAVGIIIALLVFVFDKLLKKGQLTSGDKKYEVYGIIGYIIALICFLVYRIWNANSVIAQIADSGVTNKDYSNSLIGAEGVIFTKADSITNLYDTLVSISFKFLGNNATGIFVADFLIMFLCFIFTFYAVKALYGRMEAFTVAVGTAFLPVYAIHLRDYSAYLMEYLSFAIGLYFLSVAKRLLKTKYGVEIGTILASVVIGLVYLYDNINIGLLLLLIIVILEADALNVVRKVTGIMSCLIAFALALIIPITVEAYYDTNIASIGGHIKDVFAYRLTGKFNYVHLFDFAKNNFVLIVIIACIAYVVMFLRCSFDEAHSMISLFIITLASMCYFANDDIISYSLACTMCLLVIAGAGIKKLVGFKVPETEDDMPTPPPKKKYDEQDPDIEILDEGEPVETDISVETTVEEPAEVPAEEPEEEPAEAPVEEPAGEPEEEPTESPVEEPEPAEEPTEEPMEEPNETPAETEIPVKEPVTKQVEDSVQDSPSLFITPLPMPKKGVKKVVQYDFEVPENLMHFDIELNDSNYFYDVV